MDEKSEHLAERTEDFAIDIVRRFEKLPLTVPAQTFGKQLIRSGSSVGAHYAEAQHSRSNDEFVAKVDGAKQEAQESIFWLRLISRLQCVPESSVLPLMEEASQIRAILISISAHARKRNFGGTKT